MTILHVVREPVDRKVAESANAELTAAAWRALQARLAHGGGSWAYKKALDELQIVQARHSMTRIAVQAWRLKKNAEALSSSARSR